MSLTRPFESYKVSLRLKLNLVALVNENNASYLFIYLFILILSIHVFIIHLKYYYSKTSYFFSRYGFNCAHLYSTLSILIFIGREEEEEEGGGEGDQCARDRVLPQELCE